MSQTLFLRYIKKGLTMHKRCIKYYFFTICFALICSSCQPKISAQTTNKKNWTRTPTPPSFKESEDKTIFNKNNIKTILSSKEAMNIIDLDGVEGIAQGSCQATPPNKEEFECIIIYISNNSRTFINGLPKNLSEIPTRITMTQGFEASN
jgi:hypothetical protein